MLKAPFWLDLLSPLGSTVRVVMGLSGSFEWVQLRLKGRKKRVYELGRCDPGVKYTERTFPVFRKDGETVSELRIRSSFQNAWSDEVVQEVRQMVQDLGDIWHELKI